jgi:hypothetical protein
LRDDGSMMLNATLSETLPELNGIIGLNKLSMLSGLLNFVGFKNREAKVKIKREKKKDIEVATDIIFEAAGVASASHRLMAEAAIPRQVSRVDVNWAINIQQPSKLKIAEFAQLAGIYAGLEDQFSIQVKNKELTFYIGNEVSSYKSKYTFAENIEGEIPSGFSWKIKDLISVLKLSDGTKSALKINQTGDLIQVDIDTGLCKYEFMLPAKN